MKKAQDWKAWKVSYRDYELAQQVKKYAKEPDHVFKPQDERKLPRVVLWHPMRHLAHVPTYLHIVNRQTKNCNRIHYTYESPPLKKCLSGFLMSLGKLSSFLALNPMMSSSLPSFLVHDWATNGSGFKMRHLWTTGTMGALWPPKRTTSLHTRPDWNYGNGCLSRQSV